LTENTVLARRRSSDRQLARHFAGYLRWVAVLPVVAMWPTPFDWLSLAAAIGAASTLCLLPPLILQLDSLRRRMGLAESPERWELGPDGIRADAGEWTPWEHVAGLHLGYETVHRSNSSTERLAVLLVDRDDETLAAIRPACLQRRGRVLFHLLETALQPLYAERAARYLSGELSWQSKGIEDVVRIADDRLSVEFPRKQHHEIAFADIYEVEWLPFNAPERTSLVIRHADGELVIAPVPDGLHVLPYLLRHHCGLVDRVDPFLHTPERLEQEALALQLREQDPCPLLAGLMVLACGLMSLAMTAIRCYRGHWPSAAVAISAGVVVTGVLMRRWLLDFRVNQQARRRIGELAAQLYRGTLRARLAASTVASTWAEDLRPRGGGRLLRRGMGVAVAGLAIGLVIMASVFVPFLGMSPDDELPVAWLLGMLATGAAVMWAPTQLVELWRRRALRGQLLARTPQHLDLAGGASQLMDIVPREHWRALMLEDASDFGLLQVDAVGRRLLFEGDAQRRRRAGAAIHSVRLVEPGGLGQETPVVAVAAMTAAGAVAEFPFRHRGGAGREKVAALAAEIRALQGT
jgi:hypothetical protein